jgi:hypothetical protein
MNQHITLEAAAGVPLPAEDCANLLTSLEQAMGSAILSTVDRLALENAEVQDDGVKFTYVQYVLLMQGLNRARALYAAALVARTVVVRGAR